MRFSLYHSHLCGILVFGDDLWHLYECFRLQLLVSAADEPNYLWREPGICGGEHAAGALRAGAVFPDGADDPGAAPFLRHCHAG